MEVVYQGTGYLFGGEKIASIFIHLVLQCFHKATSSRSLTLYHTTPTFKDLDEKRPFENIVGNGKNACTQHKISLFPTCFYPF